MHFSLDDFEVVCIVLHHNLYVPQTLIAKELHFAYSTPRTKRVFRKDEDLGLDGDLEDSREVPNAPRRRLRIAKSRIDFGKRDSVTVDLLPLFDDQWPSNGLAGEV